MIQKLALFDVDKTIIKNDSMFSFLYFSVKKEPITFYRILLAGLYSILYKMRLMSASKAKNVFFNGISNMQERDLRYFFNTRIKPNLFPKAIAEMKHLRQEGFHILLVTASPYAYMKYFRELDEVDDVIGTDLVVLNGKYAGEISGNNCKGEEKVIRIQSYLNKNGIEIDYNHSCAYSDSLTDLPMMNLVKHRFLINRKKIAGCEELKW